MEYRVFTAFVNDAEDFMQDKEGVAEFDFPPGCLPVPGDTVTLRVLPVNMPLEFECTQRRFDFSLDGCCDLIVDLDLA